MVVTRRGELRLTIFSLASRYLVDQSDVTPARFWHAWAPNTEVRHQRSYTKTGRKVIICVFCLDPSLTAEAEPASLVVAEVADRVWMPSASHDDRPRSIKFEAS